MSKKKIETAVFATIDRNFPPETFGDFAKALDASGVVDQILMTDQTVAWIPNSLWIPENTPMAKVVPDMDSFPDWNLMAAYAAALAPKLGSVISLDAIRRGPVELTQTMLTLANINHGNTIYQVGAGEIKQCKPNGWKRSEGLDRLEDFYRAFHAFWEAKAPISMEGHHMKLDNAWLGKSHIQRPRIWGLGGGPRVLDMATTYADGFSTMAVMVWAGPEHTAQEIKKMRDQLEAKGRDPDKFEFGVWAPLILHEDEEFITRSLDNELIRWTTAIMGRINQSDWLKEGMEPPLPADWHYAMKLIPQNVDRAMAQQMFSKVTPEMSRKSWICGSAKKAAAELQGYIDAGVSWVATIDMTPALVEPEIAASAMGRSIDVCRLIKERNK